MNILTQVLSVALRIWVLAALYYGSFRAAGIQTIEDLSAQRIVWILALTQTFGGISCFLDRKVAEEVRSGAIAVTLNRPVSYVFQHYATYFGYCAATLPFNILAQTIVALALIGPIALSPLGIVLGAFSLLVGITMHFMILMMIGLAAFWIEDVSAFSWVYQKMWIVLGGMVIPPNIFPERVRAIVEVLPFGHVFSSPARLMIEFRWEDLFFNLGWQFFWLALTFTFVTFLFSRATTRLVSNGG
jgi:ABC-2 type transport system permease protein